MTSRGDRDRAEEGGRAHTLIPGDVGAGGRGVQAVQDKGALQVGAALVAEHGPRDGAVQPQLEGGHHLVAALVGHQQRAHQALCARWCHRTRIPRHDHDPPAHHPLYIFSVPVSI